jgi:WD40 repeat protein
LLSSLHPLSLLPHCSLFKHPLDEQCIILAIDDPEIYFPNFFIPQIWHVASGELVQSIDDTFEGIYNVTWSPDGTQLAYIDTDGAIHVWGLE